MLDHYQKCPYCGKKTCYLILGYIGEPGGDDVRCYSCKRRWFTDWAHLAKFYVTKEEICPRCEWRKFVQAQIWKDYREWFNEFKA